MNESPRRYGLVALLPMKANSERVKGKNFRSFANKPLFRWILDTLLCIEAIELVVINTDARQILAEHGLVKSERILIRDRRPEICGDHVSMNLVLEDDVVNIDADVYLMTHTTNPLLSKNTISEALGRFTNERNRSIADSLFSVNRIQSRFYHEDTSPINHDPRNMIRTQDLDPWFEENSNLYCFSKGSFAETKSRIGKNPILFETPRLESVDIDDQTGWKLAEMIALSRMIAGALKQ